MSAPFKLPLKYDRFGGYVLDAESAIQFSFVRREPAGYLVQAVNSYSRREFLLQMALAHLSDDSTPAGRGLYEKIEKELNGSEG